MLRFSCVFSEEQLMLDEEFEKYIKQMERYIMLMVLMRINIVKISILPKEIYRFKNSTKFYR